MKLSEIRCNPKNPRLIKDERFKKLCQSIKEFPKMMALRPIIVDSEGLILGGNMRFKALKELGYKEVPDEWVKRDSELTEAEKQRFIIADNIGFGEYDWDILANEWEKDDLIEWGLDIPDFAFKQEAVEDDYEIPDEIETDIVLGDLFEIGQHRLLCGDSTDSDQVAKLMNGQRADMVFTDPPYGINKDIENDNLNPDKLVAFNNEWIVNAVVFLKDCGYFFIWGYFQVLAETWTKVIRPLEKVAFRNYVIWKKRGKVQGINNEDFRMFPPAYESALVFVWGQQFGNGAWSSTPNAEFYWEGYEPIRSYLDGERQKMGWDIPTIKKMVGHSDLSRDHWFSKSQWSFITKDVYDKLQKTAAGAAFRKQYDELRKQYDELRKQYDELRKQYDELRKQYDELRGYFDNTNGFTDIWEFETETQDANHPTVKPLEVCSRGIISTSKEGELVLDLFGGSGSTMVASHQLNRKCYGMEIDPKYCQVIIDRMRKLDPEIVIKKNGELWQDQRQ